MLPNWSVFYNIKLFYFFLKHEISMRQQTYGRREVEVKEHMAPPCPPQIFDSIFMHLCKTYCKQAKHKKKGNRIDHGLEWQMKQLHTIYPCLTPCPAPCTLPQLMYHLVQYVRPRLTYCQPRPPPTLSQSICSASILEYFGKYSS